MTNAPAWKSWPPAVKSASAASIFTSGCLKRNAVRLLSAVLSTTSVVPVPVTPPGAVTSAVIGVIG
jgi:hypothetical protein